MPENFYFGGGAAGSAMHPVVLALTVLAVILTLVVPRRYVLVPVVFACLLLPFTAQLFVSGLHFYVVRIVAVAAVCRLLYEKFVLRRDLLAGGVTLFDKIVFYWAICRGLALMALHPEAGAVVNQVAFWIDTFGLYVLCRNAIRETEDVLRLTKVMAFVTSVLAGCMIYEHRTGFNVYNLISSYTISPYVREGQVRAQACFGTAITAGSLGATLIPLFFWVWKCGRARTTALIGFATSVAVVYTSVSSTPVTATLAGILGLCLWPIRSSMRAVRWAIVGAVALLALVMKAPVWYIIQRVDFVGGHGWDRAFLVDQFARHISDWWLVGTDQNANWGFSTWDRCNQFVAEAAQGGVTTLVLFIALLCLAFSIAGRGRERVRPGEQWFYWCLGAALFSHVIAFYGVSYWDQMRVSWIVLLAIFPAADAWAKQESTEAEPANVNCADVAELSEVPEYASPELVSYALKRDLGLLSNRTNHAH